MLNGKVKNQIDVLVGQRLNTSIIEVHILQVAECDNYLDLVKVFKSIGLAEQYEVENLSKKVAEDFRLKLKNRFQVSAVLENKT